MKLAIVIISFIYVSNFQYNYTRLCDYIALCFPSTVLQVGSKVYCLVHIVLRSDSKRDDIMLQPALL